MIELVKLAVYWLVLLPLAIYLACQLAVAVLTFVGACIKGCFQLAGMLFMLPYTITERFIAWLASRDGKATTNDNH